MLELALAATLGVAAGIVLGWLAARQRTGTPPAPPNELQQPQRDLLHARLQRCCALRTPCVVLSTRTGAVAKCLFTSLDGESLELAVLDVGVARAMLPPALVCVQFNERKRPRVFLTDVQRLRLAPDALPQLALSVPAQIAEAEARAAVRVPVAPSSGLAVHLTTPDGATRGATASDISLMGMQLVVSGGECPPEVDDVLEVELELGSERAAVSGVVRHAEGRTLGVLFHDVLQGGVVRAPEALCRIVAQLESRWLSDHLAR